jgi:hypothetical protein
MATQAQVTANRLNAEKSTGPRTKDGKANSSQNATTHGFYSKAFVIRDDEREDFEQLSQQLREDVDPFDTAAEDLFQQILHASWNLFRLRRIENEIYASSPDPFSDPATLQKLDALRRHKGHFERALRNARKDYSQYATNCWNVTAIPPDIRGLATGFTDIHSFHKAHINKWKLYRPEDFVSKAMIKQDAEDHKVRMKAAAKERQRQADQRQASGY